jgi:8-oxo-dGTP pyrophosphatase MutT (NUDIX family)
MVQREFVRRVRYAAVYAAVPVTPQDPLAAPACGCVCSHTSYYTGFARGFAGFELSADPRYPWRMHDDPRIDGLRRVFETRTARAVERVRGQTEAAVTLLVRPHDQLEVLLIRRAETVGDPWSGHIALPGGRRAGNDPDLLGTACREAEEEVGIPVSSIGTFIGALDEVGPASPRLPPIIIAPFVMAVPAGTSAQPEPREVQAAIWVPVDALRDSGAGSLITVDLSGTTQEFPSLVYGDYVIWGLTLRILEQFLRLAGPGTTFSL